MLTIGCRYHVTAPTAATGVVFIENKRDRAFYEKWQARGYTFTVIDADNASEV